MAAVAGANPNYGIGDPGGSFVGIGAMTRACNVPNALQPTIPGGGLLGPDGYVPIWSNPGYDITPPVVSGALPGGFNPTMPPIMPFYPPSIDDLTRDPNGDRSPENAPGYDPFTFTGYAAGSLIGVTGYGSGGYSSSSTNEAYTSSEAEHKSGWKLNDRPYKWYETLPDHGSTLTGPNGQTLSTMTTGNMNPEQYYCFQTELADEAISKDITSWAKSWLEHGISNFSEYQSDLHSSGWLAVDSYVLSNKIRVNSGGIAYVAKSNYGMTLGSWIGYAALGFTLAVFGGMVGLLGYGALTIFGPGLISGISVFYSTSINFMYTAQLYVYTRLMNVGLFTITNYATGRILFRILKLRTRENIFRPTIELLKISRVLRLELHPINNSQPWYYMYPHLHLDAFGRGVGKLHIPILEPLILWGYIKEPGSD